ncbi:CGNR zinc finger domain-containing protein [Amnibacterium setariae]|uniref:Zf-CGNR multi-domain protein n=1 Tax=Amnibacterium setariae TaxID=2306585 RepID=A0A3A1TWT3_9MICO|nr:CGNR zinc finger domain-containing protein [Amnibacterium setariae]RIX28662.1 zf-CGNR multi-domain protein [Amnibacterium setariae]
MATQEPTPAPGEELSVALALVNTKVSGTRGVFDRLSEAEDADQWLRRNGLTETGQATASEWSDLAQLRADARSVLEALEAHRAPEDTVLGRLNTVAAAPVRPVLRTHGPRLELQWEPTSAEPPAARVARDLAAFAVSEAAARVRTCAADDCDRMFVPDHGRRIWCSPACGNRMRVQRHAAKARATRLSSAR